MKLFKVLFKSKSLPFCGFIIYSFLVNMITNEQQSPLLYVILSPSPVLLVKEKLSRYQQASQKFKENDKTFEFKKHVSTETSVIFS